jgi:regulator of nucleoside diphosphate kinase
VKKKKNVIITEADYLQLQGLIARCTYSSGRDVDHLAVLAEELDRATVVKRGEVAGDVVTMNSRVRVKDLNTGREVTYQIVFPGNADIAKNRISVLAPVGTGLLGHGAGATVEWQAPSGIRRMRILAVEYQPEAAHMAA